MMKPQKDGTMRENNTKKTEQNISQQNCSGLGEKVYLVGSLESQSCIQRIILTF